MGTAAGTVIIPETGSYEVDPAGSTITFTTRHIFGLGPVKGTFTLRSGSVVVALPTTASLVVAAIDTASFSSGNPQRDKHIRSGDFLDAAHHPEIVFTSTGVGETEHGWILRGEITARGVIAPIELKVIEVGIEGETITFRVTGTVDRYAHSITKMKGMAGRYLELDIRARAVRSGLS
jgi:polyisoprenoid-binding protein YceI